MLRLLLPVFVLLLAGTAGSSTVRAQSPGVELDLGQQLMRYRWDLGKHDREFALEISRTMRVTHGAGAVRFELALTHPNLYEHFLASLSSERGYTTIAEALGMKAQLGRMNYLNLSYDPSRQAAWLRMEARIRLKAPLVRTTDNRDITVEFATRLDDGRLNLTVQSLNISGVPGELDKIIARSIKPVSFQLSECLAEKSATLEQASFSQTAQALKIAVSVPTTQFLAAFWCLAKS